MKSLLRKLFSPLLNIFESGEGPYSYRKSHRVALNIVGSLFIFLSLAVLGAGISFEQAGAALPGLIFIAVGVTCFVVGTLGSDRAVAKIWGNRK